MVYGVITHVAAPIEAYDAVHARCLAQQTEGPVDSLLVDIGCRDGDGSQVIEVWESRERFDQFSREVVAPMVAEAGGGVARDGPSRVEEFEVRGLMVPRGPVAFSCHGPLRSARSRSGERIGDLS
jgi:hypothetical protein